MDLQCQLFPIHRNRCYDRRGPQQASVVLAPSGTWIKALAGGGYEDKNGGTKLKTLTKEKRYRA